MGTIAGGGNTLAELLGQQGNAYASGILGGAAADQSQSNLLTNLLSGLGGLGMGLGSMGGGGGGQQTSVAPASSTYSGLFNNMSNTSPTIGGYLGPNYGIKYSY